MMGKDVEKSHEREFNLFSYAWRHFEKNQNKAPKKSHHEDKSSWEV